ncbi:hypothetical protein [uncultured Chloroflexus sp.]|uniref:hypothetical protein n=1 Tax=uncultured Chloroflexus sp. TaxID=214040 RepID=UPI00261609E1|nr:hypothetical protein [uncultured Chloroflexus sp.]
MTASPLLRFYLLAFGLAWLGWLPAALGSRGITPFTAPVWQVLLILPAVAPALAAGVVARRSYGTAQANALFAALLQWRVADDRRVGKGVCRAVRLAGRSAGTARRTGRGGHRCAD